MPFYGFLSALPDIWSAVILLVLLIALGYLRAPFWTWPVATALVFYAEGSPVWLWVIFVFLPLLFMIPAVRRPLLSRPIMNAMRSSGFLPKISPTEQTAIAAGTVWVDGELFSGSPDFGYLMTEPYPELTEEEQAFLDGPVEEVCRMTDDWDVFQRGDLSPEVWDYLKKHRFFGMIIPKEYGGLGFSALANSAVVQKCTTRSLPLSITVMVPNSLGPAELLIHYGTDEQRDYYLPRLAVGEDIPAFALTEAGAGSDAGAIESSGEVFRGSDGALYLRLNWKKRYITLAAVSTVLGLAFKLRDPENLLGKGTEPGITCALIPTDTPGVETGRRHDPLGIPFINSPTEGHDVVVPVDAIIGGADGAGLGWRMLMESLAAGRGISLPAQSCGGAKLVCRVAGGHAAVRKQFGLPIGRFEGIEEALARIAGYTYILEASRRFTCGGIDRGAKPAVVTAIAKYNSTEMSRQIVNDGMDILGGNAIARGPRNLLAHGYMSAPIGITVEGANILTRTLMIFGQGAIRCHPYAYREIDALARGDIIQFDGALWGHFGHVVRLACRSLVLSLTRGYLSRASVDGAAARYVRKLNWASASFALLADLAMAGLGGNLKRKEMITGRFADIFSWLYLATAALRRHEAEGRRGEDLSLLHWSMQTALAKMQEGFDGLYQNLRVPGLTWLLRGPVFLWSRMNRLSSSPSDRLKSQLARIIQAPGPQRDRMTSGIYVSSEPEEALGRLEEALIVCVEADAILGRIKSAARDGKLAGTSISSPTEAALEAGIISGDEAGLVRRAERARADYVLVDSFTLEEYGRLRLGAEGEPADGITYQTS